MKEPKYAGPALFLHFLEFGFVVGVVAHFAHPGLGEEDRRIPEEADDHRGNCGDKNGE
jgi:hypothetical protein